MRIINRLGEAFTRAWGASKPEQEMKIAGSDHMWDVQQRLIGQTLGYAGGSLKDQLDRIDAEKAALMARIAMDDLRLQFDVLHLPAGWGLVLASANETLPSFMPSYALVRLVFKDTQYDLVVFVDDGVSYAGLFDVNQMTIHNRMPNRSHTGFVPTAQNAVVCAQSKVDLLMLMIAMNSQEGPTDA